MSDRPSVLIVEDDENDVLLLDRVFAKSKILNPLHIVRSGEEAVRYLTGAGRYADRGEYPLPGLLLLDLKLPGMDGFELLRWIRQESELPCLRVVVLTSSDEIRDVKLAYQQGADSFLTKPIDFERFCEISQTLGGGWIWFDKPPRDQMPQPTARLGSVSELEEAPTRR